MFAFALTVLVLDIRAPERADIHTEAKLLSAMGLQAPRLLTWLLSLVTLGIFWVGQQTQLNHLKRADRDFTWLSYLFLAVVTALPFSTRLRIIVAQSLYGLGALIGVLNTLAGGAFPIAVQLNYAIAPAWQWRRWRGLVSAGAQTENGGE